MSERMRFSMLFPLLAAIIIVIYGGGLGVIFMLMFGEVTPHSEELEEEAAAFITTGELSVVILGLVITIGVPLVAYFLQKKFEGSDSSSLAS